MSTEMNKVAALLRDARETVIKVAGERDSALQLAEQETARADAAEEKLAAVLTRLEAEKLAFEMHEKGLNRDVSMSDLIADIEKRAAEGKLPVIREAVKMAAPSMGQHIGSISNDESRGSGMSDFEAYLVGGVG